MKFWISIALSLSLLTVAQPIAVAATAAPVEFYSDRPSILQINAAGSLKNSDRKVLRGLIDFIAELRAFYPESVFYVLARDGEPVFDLWRLLFPQDLESGRVKLVNISSISRESENLVDYMAATGLTKDAARGRHVVAVDSGYEGSIVDAINAVLAKQDSGKMRAHLMSSAHSEIPSSRISTRPFLSAAKRKKVEDKDYVSEAAEMAVEALEKIPHYTVTSTGFAQKRGGKWDAISEPNTDEGRGDALDYMRGLRAFAAEEDTVQRVRLTEKLFARLMKAIQSPQALKRADIEALTSDLKAAELEEVYADLRESIGKETVTHFNPKRLMELWDYVPAKLYELNDIDDDEGLNAVEEREQELEELAEAQEDQLEGEDSGFWVADIIRLYLNALEPAEVKARTRIHEEFMENIKNFSRRLGGKSAQVGKKIGEGVRSDVYLLGEDHVIKVAYEPEDMAAIEGEAQVYDFLKLNAGEFPVQLLEILERGERGMFLIKPRVEKETIGKYILKANGKLSPAQLRSLEDVYNVSRRLAEQTGISLDIKSDNLYWTKKGWAILDLGARTMSHPYFFTLERKSFAEYLEIWNSDSGSREGVMDVEDYIRQSRRACEDAVITGYRELKADQ